MSTKTFLLKELISLFLSCLFILTLVVPFNASAAAATPEQLNQAQSIVSKGERLSSRIGAMKTQAEREQDIIRVNCLNTKLAEVNANLRNAKSRLSSLRQETDKQRVTQAMTVMLVLGQKFQVLDQQANQCIGQNVFETGATKVDTEIDTILTCIPACDLGEKCKTENNVAKCVSEIEVPSIDAVPVAPPPAAACTKDQYKAADETCKNLTSCTTSQYESKAATKTSDRVCSELTACTANQYESKAATATSDRVCSALTACTNSQYESKAATATSNRVCSALTACSANQYESKAATASSDRVCSALTACSANQYESKVATSTSDRVCSALTSCTANQYESKAATSTSDRVCSTLTSCTADQYESKAATSTSDRECSALTSCTADQYESKAAAATSDRECKAVTTCATGQYEVKAATKTSDTVCGNPPVAKDDSKTLSADSSSTIINVLENDNDPDNDKLTVTAIDKSNVKGFLLLGKNDGVISYDPNNKFNDVDKGKTATDSFTYTVSDGNETATATVTITINGVKEVPKACPDNCSGNGQCSDGTCKCNEGFSGERCEIADNTPPVAKDDTHPKILPASWGTTEIIDVLTNDTDADEDQLTVIKVDYSGTKGLVGLYNGAIDYALKIETDSEGLVGELGDIEKGKIIEDTFKYTVSDGKGGEDTATVTIRIEGVKEIPLACPDNCNDNGQCKDGTCDCNAGYEGKSCAVGSSPSGGKVVSTASQVDSEGTVAVTASSWNSATGSTLSYSWSATCEGGLGKGSFNDNKAQVDWKAPKNETGKVQKCTLTAAIEDTGNKGKTTSSTDVEINFVKTTSTTTTGSKTVKKVMSIKPKKTEYKKGEDNEIIFTVTLSCPDDHPFECSANECAKDERSCPASNTSFQTEPGS